MSALQLCQLRTGQFNQRLDRRGIELEPAAGGGKQFRQRARAAERERFFVVVQRLCLVAF
jgi:hypothetical protein